MYVCMYVCVCVCKCMYVYTNNAPDGTINKMSLHVCSNAVNTELLQTIRLHLHAYKVITSRKYL